MSKSAERESEPKAEGTEAELELLGLEQWEQAGERARRRKARKLAHAANRKRQRGGHLDRRAWREAPATAKQIEALRTMATESGRTFKLDVTRGEAWRRIRERRRCSMTATGSPALRRGIRDGDAQKDDGLPA